MSNRQYTKPDSNRFQKKPFRKSDEKPQGRKNFQSNEKGFSSRNDNYQGKDNKFRPKDGKFRPKDSRFKTDRNQPYKGKSSKPWEQQKIPRIVSDMQVTDGKLKGKYLKSTDSPKVRPTARRIREVMFRILFRRVRAGRFLDLCAGAGTVGIEAISRGALLTTFVERSAKMCGFIKKNLEALEIKEGHGTIFEMEVIPFLKKMNKRRRFWDVVYFDPPYDANYDEILEYFSRGIAIKPGGILVIEHHSEMFFSEKIGVLKRWRVVTQGETSLSFYERKS